MTRRPRVTYANVMTTLAVFLLLAGGTAIAAKQLGKKTVGAKQLKGNAVTTAKIKKAAVTKSKIKDGAVDGAKILDGSVTGTEINAASTPFGQVIARLRNTTPAPFTPETAYPLGSYTQNAGEDNVFIGSLDVNFPASCEPPRIAQAYVLIDAPKPSEPTKSSELAGLGIVQDTNPGAVTRRMEFSPFPGGSPMGKFAPAATTTHTFDFFLVTAECKAGGGITVTGAALDILGFK